MRINHNVLLLSVEEISSHSAVYGHLHGSESSVSFRFGLYKVVVVRGKAITNDLTEDWSISFES